MTYILENRDNCFYVLCNWWIACISNFIIKLIKSNSDLNVDKVVFLFTC
ncbi:unnamed protein product [Tenebrio molitor]|nr:unnamed protein product [Tenebrio molitor]